VELGYVPVRGHLDALRVGEPAQHLPAPRVVADVRLVIDPANPQQPARDRGDPRGRLLAHTVWLGEDLPAAVIGNTLSTTAGLGPFPGAVLQWTGMVGNLIARAIAPSGNASRGGR
jgi:hypothetical protein